MRGYSPSVFLARREHPEVCDALLDLVGRLYPRNVVPSFGQQQPNHLLGFGVFSFTEVLEAEVALEVEDVFGGPVAVVEVAPGGEVVVLNDQPAEISLFGGVADLVDVFLEVELGSVNSEDGEPVVFVALMPCPQGRPSVLAVVSSVGPEVD